MTSIISTENLYWKLTSNPSNLEAQPPSDTITCMRKISFVANEFYHIYNRGVDRRLIFSNKYDLERFFQNPNHYYFIITQLEERGIEKFMHRLGTGYTRYFNERHVRTGSLFQGRFKASHIDSNEYLLHASVYVNLNYKVHKLNRKKDLFLSSWNEYLDDNLSGICAKNIIREQFKTLEDYERFSKNTLVSILERKELLAELENEHLEAQHPSGRKRV